MNDLDARALLEDAASDIDPSPSPSTLLLEQGRRRRRTTHWVQAVGAGAAMVVIAAGSVWLSGDDSPHRGSPQPAAPTSGTPESNGDSKTVPPSDPSGTQRLVGYGPIAVIVPRSWAVDRLDCGGGVVENAVVFEPSPHGDCPLVQGDFSSVHFGPIDSWTPQPKAFDALSTETVGSIDVQRSSGVGWLFQYGVGDVTKEMRAAVLFIPSADVVMWVQSPDPAIVERVMDSVQAVPAGSGVVPDVYEFAQQGAAEGAIIRAGFALGIKGVERPGLSPGQILGVQPESGTIAPKGSTVTLLVTVPVGTAEDDVVRYVRDLAIGVGDRFDLPPYGPITLGLGGEVIRREPLYDLLGREKHWVIHRPDFKGFVGPFSAREKLLTDPSTWQVTEEGQQCCSWERADDLPGFEDDRRYTIETTDFHSGTDWWAVDVYVNDDGVVEAISLNLGSP